MQRQAEPTMQGPSNTACCAGMRAQAAARLIFLSPKHDPCMILNIESAKREVGSMDMSGFSAKGHAADA
eukprot:1159220-Pelagomonas_calceolata.AAC.5